MDMESLEHVSAETKRIMGLWQDHIMNRLMKEGFQVEELTKIMDNLKESALTLTVNLSAKDWEEKRKACTAEGFVQRFCRCLWKGACRQGKSRRSSGLSRLPPSSDSSS